MEQWLEASLFLAGGSRGAGSDPGVATYNFFFFFLFHRIFTLGFLLFILTVDPVSFARFLRKRISRYVKA